MPNNAYPTLPTGDDSGADIDLGLEPARATNGALRVRARYPADKRSFTLHHMLTAAQYTALQTFRNANRLLDVDLYWLPHNATYTVRLVGYQERCVHSELWDVTVKLEEV
jgi:hypothetical protein